VTCSLIKVFPPANIMVSEDGKVTWSVPPNYADFAGQEAVALIKVNDATGRPILHRLNILVR
jgi:hypothetical protein